MIRAILVAAFVSAWLSPATAAIECDSGDRAAYIATFQRMIHNAEVFEVLGKVSKVNNVCTIRLLTALGKLEIGFDVRTNQGNDYIHVLSQQRVTE